MLKRFSKYVFQSVASMMGQSVYILADTFFISVSSGADGLAVRMAAEKKNTDIAAGLLNQGKANGQVVRTTTKIYPNDPCPCGSGKKYKKCCGKNQA